MGYTFKVGDTARESGLEGHCHNGGYYYRARDGGDTAGRGDMARGRESDTVRQ